MASDRKLASIESAIYVLRGQRVMLEAIADLFAALKRLLEPPEPPKRREIGFHERERTGRYRVNRRF